MAMLGQSPGDSAKEVGGGPPNSPLSRHHEFTTQEVNKSLYKRSRNSPTRLLDRPFIPSLAWRFLSRGGLCNACSSTRSSRETPKGHALAVLIFVPQPQHCSCQPIDLLHRQYSRTTPSNIDKGASRSLAVPHTLTLSRPGRDETLHRPPLHRRHLPPPLQQCPGAWRHIQRPSL